MWNLKIGYFWELVLLMKGPKLQTRENKLVFCSEYLWSNFSFLLVIIELLLMLFCEFLSDM